MQRLWVNEEACNCCFNCHNTVWWVPILEYVTQSKVTFPESCFGEGVEIPANFKMSELDTIIDSCPHFAIHIIKE